MRMFSGDSSWYESAVRPAIAGAVDRVGLKEFAFRCDVAPSLLADQLAERNSKALRVRQLCTLLELAPETSQDELVASLVVPAGYETPKRRQPLTDKERADRLESKLLALGPLGAQILADAMGSRR
jgi:hypothetical protein